MIDLPGPSSVCVGEKIGNFGSGWVRILSDRRIVATHQCYVWVERDSYSRVAKDAGDANGVGAEVAARWGRWDGWWSHRIADQRVGLISVGMGLETGRRRVRARDKYIRVR